MNTGEVYRNVNEICNIVGGTSGLNLATLWAGIYMLMKRLKNNSTRYDKTVTNIDILKVDKSRLPMFDS